MSRSGRPRVHTHLNRASIARAGLEIVDRDGLEALSLRTAAEALGVGTMTLYAHTPDREALEKDIIESLLAEVDTCEVPGETWDDSVRRVARSLRHMTLRHPHAFALIAAAPTFEPPVLDYAARITRLHRAQNIDEQSFLTMWGVIDAFLTGFMVMVAQAAIQARVVARRPAAPEEHGEEQAAGNGVDLAAGLTAALSEEAFERSLEVVIAGLRATVLASTNAPTTARRRSSSRSSRRERS
jgi:AcrR family transcriptional regulator